MPGGARDRMYLFVLSGPPDLVGFAVFMWLQNWPWVMGGRGWLRKWCFSCGVLMHMESMVEGGGWNPGGPPRVAKVSQNSLATSDVDERISVTPDVVLCNVVASADAGLSESLMVRLMLAPRRRHACTFLPVCFRALRRQVCSAFCRAWKWCVSWWVLPFGIVLRRSAYCFSSLLGLFACGLVIEW